MAKGLLTELRAENRRLRACLEAEKEVWESNTLAYGAALNKIHELEGCIEEWKAIVANKPWQPISTAPRNGIKFLAWWSYEEKVLPTYWLDNTHTQTPWAGWKAPSLQVSHPKAMPTHWMPMPGSPSTSGENGV